MRAADAVRDEPVWRWAPADPERPLLTTSATGTLPAAAVESAADALAGGLAALGVVAGDHVLVAGTGLAATVTCHLATQRLGAVLVPLRSRDGTAHHGARVVVTPDSGGWPGLHVVLAAETAGGVRYGGLPARRWDGATAPAGVVMATGGPAPRPSARSADAFASASALVADTLGVPAGVPVGFAVPHLDPAGLGYATALVHGRCHLVTRDAWDGGLAALVVTRTNAVAAVRAARAAGATVGRVVALGRVRGDGLRAEVVAAAGEDVLVEHGVDDDGVVGLVTPPGDLAGFWSWARARPDQVAVEMPGGRSLTARELLARVEWLAPRLAAAAPGGTVVAGPRDDVDLLVTYLAAVRGGVHLRVADPDEDLAALRAAGADVVVGDVAGEGVETVETLARREPASPATARAGALLPSTSGTTGGARLVRSPLEPRSPEWAAAQDRVTAARLGLPPGGCHLVPNGLHQAAALTLARAALHRGQTLLVMPRWVPADALALLGRQDVTSAFMVPSMFGVLLQAGTTEQPPALVSVVHGGAPCPAEVKAAMTRWWGPVLYEHYSAAEGVGTYVTPREWERRPGTVGRPFPGVDVRVLARDGTDCPPGVVGDVYLTDSGFAYADGSAPFGRRDGLVSLGDRGYLDEAGWLYLRGRETEYLSVGGAKFHPGDVEDVLRHCDGVADCAVTGIPHRYLGQVAVAHVVPSDPPHEPLTALRSRLLAHARATLPAHQVPVRVLFLDVLPRDPNGKLRRRELT